MRGDTSSPDSVETSGAPARAHRVYRRWERARGRYFQRHLLRETGAELDFFNVYALLVLLAIAPVDLALLGFAGALGTLAGLAALPAPDVVTGFLVVTCANAIRVDRQLGRWGSGGREVRPWVRCARASLFSLPLASVVALPLWRRAVHRWPGLSGGERRRAEPATLRGGDRSMPLSLPARVEAAVLGVPGAALWFVAELVIALWASLWFAIRFEESAAVLLGTGGAAHLAAAGALWAGSRTRSRDLRAAAWRRRLGRWTPLVALAPVPIGWVAAAFDLLTTARASSLVWSGFAWNDQPDRIAAWWGLRRQLRRRHEEAGWKSRWTEPSGGTRRPESTAVDLRLRELIHAKALLSLGDGVLTGWAAVAIAGGVGGNPDGTVSLRDPLLGPPLLIVGSGVVLAAAGYLGLALRVPACTRLARQPYAEALVWVGWALGLGILVGRLLAGGATDGALALLAVGSALPISFSAIGMILRPLVTADSPRFHDAAWILSPLLWSVLAVCWAQPGPWIREVVATLVVLTPLWHLLLGLTLGRWLLWPFRFHDLGARELPIRLRRILALLAASLLLPFGGIAAPLWIYLRARRAAAPPDHLAGRKPPWPFGALCAAAGVGLAGLVAGSAGAIVQATGVVLLVAGAISFSRNPFTRGAGEWSPLLWIVVYLVLAVAGYAMAMGSPLTAGLTPALELTALASPLFGGLVGALMAIAPGVRSARDPGRRSTPPVFVPLLGGLVVPWWRHLADRPHGEEPS